MFSVILIAKPISNFLERVALGMLDFGSYALRTISVNDWLNRDVDNSIMSTIDNIVLNLVGN